MHVSYMVHLLYKAYGDSFTSDELDAVPNRRLAEGPGSNESLLSSPEAHAGILLLE